MRTLSIVLVTALIVLAGCTNSVDPTLEALRAREVNPTTPCGEVLRSYESDPSVNPALILETSQGNVTVDLYFQENPTMVGEIMLLADGGFYDNQRFYSIIEGVVLAAGDPKTGQEELRRQWGSIEPGEYGKLPIVHHRFLRHDAAGTFSLLVPTPEITPPYFQIELNTEPGLDDIMPILGRVSGTASWEAIAALERTPTDDDNRPTSGANLHRVVVQRPDAPASGTGTPLLSSPDCVQVTKPGFAAEFLVFAANAGSMIDTFEFVVDAPDGWEVEVVDPVVPAGQTRGTIVSVTPSAEATGAHPIRVTASGEAGQDAMEVEVRIGDVPELPKDIVVLDYAAFTEDGRVMASTEPRLSDASVLPLFKSADTGRDPVPNRTVLEDGRILGLPEGFQEILSEARIHGARYELLRPEQAWGSNWIEDPKAGRNVWFMAVPRAEG